MAFYEGNGMVSASGYTSEGHSGSMEDVANYWYTGDKASDPHAFNYMTVDSESQ